MTGTILHQIFILVLTLISLFTCRFPTLFIAAAGLLMVLVAYRSFQEESRRVLAAAGFVLMTAFAVLSGSFAGFCVFFLFVEVRASRRVVLGVCLFLLTSFVSLASPAADEGVPFAMRIVQALLLAAVFLFLMLLQGLAERAEKRKIREEERLIASNVSEMHEKRLNEQLVVRNFLAEKAARMAERENISRNIHNSVGHSITAAIMTLEAADALYDVRPEEARKRMNDANDRIRGSLESIRRAVRVLDEESAEISAGDLKREMEDIINGFIMDTNMCVDQDGSQLTDDIGIPRDHAVFLTGALQEMLTNGVKHGNASEFVVTLSGDTAHVRLEVRDNGHSDFGSQNAAYRIESGFGIRKMISYVEKCGGKTAFVNDNGFKGTVELPTVFAE